MESLASFTLPVHGHGFVANENFFQNILYSITWYTQKKTQRRGMDAFMPFGTRLIGAHLGYYIVYSYFFYFFFFSSFEGSRFIELNPFAESFIATVH